MGADNEFLGVEEMVSHKENEKISLASLEKAVDIYTEAIKNLLKK